MAIELKFYKTDNSPWGFRLTGGADCDVPLTVIKIVQESIADINGLRVGDVIVRINEDSVADCTHEEVHELISEAGQQLIFGIRRDYYTNEDEEDENNNLEVSHIMNSTFKESAHQLETTEKYEQTKHNSSMSSITDEQIAEAISGQAEVLDQNILGVNFNKIDLSQSTILNVMEQQKLEEGAELKERKWSAFLQKPERPIMKPKPKSLEPKAPPYQVVIKKQKRKNTVIDAQCSSEPEPTQEENQQCIDSLDNENQEIDEIDDADSLEVCDNEQNLNEDEDDGENENENEIEDDDRESINLDNSEDEFTENNDTKEEVEVQLSVDEQLAQVQMQLRALAQLPSSIQDNLESVTQQLTRILFATQLRSDTENNLDSAHSSRGDSFERSLDEILDNKEETENLDEERDIAEDEEYKSNVSETSERGHSDEDEAQETVHQEYEEEEDIFEPKINEEELERLRIETDKNMQKERNVNILEESHQRRLEQRPTYPLAPVQRPIILPGGRKWAQPDDAVPVRKKKSSLSDEKIIKTLDTYSETIVGHTKGINFLKFQPPAKNLDYLQKSEVYKLIHDMDPPPKGIATRPEIVPSEQDYYTKGQ